jgi:hypothetical protein
MTSQATVGASDDVHRRLAAFVGRGGMPQLSAPTPNDRHIGFTTAQTTLPPDPSGAYAPHSALKLSTSNSPRPPSDAWQAFVVGVREGQFEL